jgi:hypothetical protein
MMERQAARKQRNQHRSPECQRKPSCAANGRELTQQCLTTAFLAIEVGLRTGNE